MVDPKPETFIFDKEMGITHKDFFRVLPGALDGLDFSIDGKRITADGGGGRHLEITLSEESQRRIAGLTLPVTLVRLSYSGYTRAEAAAALARFDRAFQRAGG